MPRDAEQIHIHRRRAASLRRNQVFADEEYSSVGTPVPSSDNRGVKGAEAHDAAQRLQKGDTMRGIVQGGHGTSNASFVILKDERRKATAERISTGDLLHASRRRPIVDKSWSCL